jgi:hypothetical protein
MSYQTLVIQPDDGEQYELKVTARDALMWERTGKDNPSILAYLSYPSMVEAYRLAHIVAKRTGKYEGSLKDFEATHDLSIATMMTTDDEPDPTNPEASADD